MAERTKQSRICHLTDECMWCCLFIPDPSVGAADEGAQAGGEAEEGAGAAVQHAAHRVQPHTVRDADAGYPSSQIPATKSHGESPEMAYTKK